MLRLFHPGFGSVWKPPRIADDLTERLADQVGSGLFSAASERRNNYEVVSQDNDVLRFRSTSLLTGINIGRNDIELRLDRTSETVSFVVSFWTWTRYRVFLGLGLAAVSAATLVLRVLVGFFLLPEHFYPSREEMLLAAVPMVAFWCLIWPWVLVSLHKRFGRKGLVRLLDEVNSGGS